MLRLADQCFEPDALLIMAIVNRTPDSFYDRGATYGFEVALERVRSVVADGAQIVDIGGVKAAPGDEVDAAEEIRRTVDFVARVRSEFPQLLISVDTWRHEVGRAVCEAGANLLNDAWGGHDPELAGVAAQFDAGLVCTHAGGAQPRTRPHRIHYDDIVAEVLRWTQAEAQRAVSLGVSAERVLIDPGHDFGKNTWHSLELTGRVSELVATGWPVLVSLSNKDFIGEALDLPVEQRLLGTLSATALCAWQGAMVFRAHNVPETRQVLDLVAAVRGSELPRRVVRGLA